MGLFKKKQDKDPICGMEVNENFISKHGEKFCSDGCVAKYEEKHQIAGDKHSKKSGGCCCS